MNRRYQLLRVANYAFVMVCTVLIAGAAGAFACGVAWVLQRYLPEGVAMAAYIVLLCVMVFAMAHALLGPQYKQEKPNE